jgi:hypothetical protein
LLYAVLSQQPLAARKSTLTFAQEIFDSTLRKDRGMSLKMLEVLLSGYRYRHGSDRYTGTDDAPGSAARGHFVLEDFVGVLLSRAGVARLADLGEQPSREPRDLWHAGHLPLLGRG